MLNDLAQRSQYWGFNCSKHRTKETTSGESDSGDLNSREHDAEEQKNRKY